MTDHYKVLGLTYSSSITPEMIKSAYKRKVLTEHPDKGGTDERFQVVQRAYECLSNPDRKLIYDRSTFRSSTSSSIPFTSYGTPHMPTPFDMNALFAHMFSHTQPPPRRTGKNNRPPPPERKSRLWTPEEEKQLLDRVAQGKTFKMIAGEHQRTPSAIGYRLRILACRMHREGRSMEEICRVTALKPGSVNKALQKKSSR